MSACRPKRRWWVICKPLSDSMETQLLKITTLAAVAVHDQNELNCRELLYPSDCEQRGKLLRRLRKLHPELMTWTKSEADMPEYWIKQLVRRTYSTCSRATKLHLRLRSLRSFELLSSNIDLANSLPESWTNFTGKYASIEPFNNVTAPVSTFAGRRGFLKRVHWALQECSSNRPLNSRITALVGFGGTGKSEVARKLVSVYSQTYTKVAWIDATMESTADQSFMQIAAFVSLPDCKKFAGKELAQAVYRYIQRNSDGPALFILDNATQLSSSGNTFGIADYLPADGTGNLPILLITSQTREWATHAYKMVELPELSQEERIQFLQYTFRLSDVELRKDSELGGLIEKLCEQLPGHPQTLTLVASNIPYTPGTSSLETLKDALDAWVQCRGYDQVLELDAGPYVATDYPNSILNNWNSAMKNLDRLGRVSDARLLLGILNYLPGDHSGCRVLQKVHQGVRRGLCIPSSGQSDEEIFEEALRNLHMVSLIQVEGDVRDTDAVVGVQRLIQAMVRFHERVQPVDLSEN